MPTIPSKDREADYTKISTHIFSFFHPLHGRERERTVAFSPTHSSHAHSSVYEPRGSNHYVMCCCVRVW